LWEEQVSFAKEPCKRDDIEAYTRIGRFVERTGASERIWLFCGRISLFKSSPTNRLGNLRTEPWTRIGLFCGKELRAYGRIVLVCGRISLFERATYKNRALFHKKREKLRDYSALLQENWDFLPKRVGA